MDQIDRIYGLFLSANQSISTDTRNIIPGSIFFALKGSNFDGNQFAQEAIAKGAKYAVVDDSNLANFPKMIYVENVLDTLQQLALKHRTTLNVPIIAITGSNGKTTTKELLNAVLTQKFSVTCTQGNLNNHIGVPLTLLKIRPYDDLAIIEMGANHVGEIASYCAYTKPDYGLITNVGRAHLEGFGSFEGVKKGKSELYQFLANHHKIIFVNQDDHELVNLIPKNAKVNYYTTTHNSKMTVTTDDNQGKLNVHINENDKNITIYTHLVGNYNLSNIMAAFTIGSYFEVDTDLIIKAIGDYNPNNNRSQIVKQGSTEIIMDAYNANPSSMKAALESFSKQEGNKVVILGAMKELGQDSKAEHTQLVNFASELSFDKIVLVGEEYENISLPTNAIFFRIFQEAKDWYILQNWHQAKILIKGSRGIALERLLA